MGWNVCKSCILQEINTQNIGNSPQLNIRKTKIMASGPITSWKIDGEKLETITDFIFLDSKITVDSDCSHEIKRCSLEEKL